MEADPGALSQGVIFFAYEFIDSPIKHIYKKCEPNGSANSRPALTPARERTPMAKAERNLRHKSAYREAVKFFLDRQGAGFNLDPILTPERDLLRHIADRSDLLTVGRRCFLLVPMKARHLDVLAEFESDDREPDITEEEWEREQDLAELDVLQWSPPVMDGFDPFNDSDPKETIYG